MKREVMMRSSVARDRPVCFELKDREFLSYRHIDFIQPHLDVSEWLFNYDDHEELAREREKEVAGAREILKFACRELEGAVEEERVRAHEEELVRANENEPACAETEGAEKEDSARAALRWARRKLKHASVEFKEAREKKLVRVRRECCNARGERKYIDDKRKKVEAKCRKKFGDVWDRWTHFGIRGGKGKGEGEWGWGNSLIWYMRGPAKQIKEKKCDIEKLKHAVVVLDYDVVMLEFSITRLELDIIRLGAGIAMLDGDIARLNCPIGCRRQESKIRKRSYFEKGTEDLERFVENEQAEICRLQEVVEQIMPAQAATSSKNQEEKLEIIQRINKEQKEEIEGLQDTTKELKTENKRLVDVNTGQASIIQKTDAQFKNQQVELNRTIQGLRVQVETLQKSLESSNRENTKLEADIVRLKEHLREAEGKLETMAVEHGRTRVGESISSESKSRGSGWLGLFSRVEAAQPANEGKEVGANLV